MSNCQSGQKTGHSITETGVAVEHCTTDGDSHLHKSVAEFMQEVDPSLQVKRLADLVHLSQTQVRYAKRKTLTVSATVSFWDDKEDRQRGL